MSDRESEAWYIVKQLNGSCEIIPAEQWSANESAASEDKKDPQHWGPFNSRNDAIARRVGLIRAGKCQPV